MHTARSPKHDPHTCRDCGASFEVAYLDDRTGDRAQSPLITVDVPCPRCGKRKSLSLPAGAERTLEVELDEVGEPDEGGGG